MDAWRTKRKLIYGGSVAVVCIVVVLMLIWPLLSKQPTCMDGRQNGTEQGVDCGGSCTRLCLFQVEEIKVLWARAFPVTSNVYNAVAYIENQNVSSAVASIPYEFRLYDEKNLLIGIRTGQTFITPNNRSAIFEAGIDVGNRVPTMVRFHFLAAPTWVRFSQADIDAVPIVVTHQDVIDRETSPRLVTTIVNRALFSIPDLDLVAILYGADGNALQTSALTIPRLQKSETKTVTFTWPDPILKEVTRVEIIPRINMFSTRPR